MNIALVAKRGSGKTTVSDALQRQGYRRLSWADPVRDIAAMAYDRRFIGSPAEYAAAKAATFEVRHPDGSTEVITGTQVLQRIGTDAIRDHLDQDFWIRAGLRRLDESAHDFTALSNYTVHSDGTVDADYGTVVRTRWVNDDTRFPNELAALRSRGFVIVGLYCPDAVRIARLIERDGAFDAAAESHASENSVGLGDCDVVIDTAKSVDEVMAQLWHIEWQGVGL